MAPITEYRVEEVVTGPADLYYRLFTSGAEMLSAMPANPSLPIPAGWTLAGLVEDEVNITTAQTYEAIRAAQVVDRIHSVMTEREVTVELGLMQNTLSNFRFVNNGGTVTTGANVREFRPIVDVVNTETIYHGVLIRGRAGSSLAGGTSSPKRDLLILRSANTEDVEAGYSKGGANVLNATLVSHLPGDGLEPYIYRDYVA